MPCQRLAQDTQGAWAVICGSSPGRRLDLAAQEPELHRWSPVSGSGARSGGPRLFGANARLLPTGARR